MLQYPNIDPVIFSVGVLKIHWYGLMYLLGFTFAFILGNYRAKKTYSKIEVNKVSDIIFYGALGVILGGRIGFMIFYDFNNLISSPLSIFKVWDGGMSFHGGLIGVLVSLYFYALKHKIHLFDILDFIAPMVAIGLFFGRIGNFINDELWGRVTSSSIGMIFPSGGPLPRYPSQLIEALLEGLVLFLILWFISNKKNPRYLVSGFFALFYGLFRFICEFYREPDPQLGYILWNNITMGQILSIPMIFLGLLLIFIAQKNKNKSIQ